VNITGEIWGLCTSKDLPFPDAGGNWQEPELGVSDFLWADFWRGVPRRYYIVNDRLCREPGL